MLGFVALLALTSQTPLKERWFYLATNLLVDANRDADLKLLERAKTAGYNGVLVSDSKFWLLREMDQMGPRYRQNATAVRNKAKELGLKFVTTVAPIGYSNDLLLKNSNLAEGLPVVDAPFTVTNEGAPKPIDFIKISNPGFEDASGDTPKGWGWVDQPGKIAFIDKETKFEGAASLRMQDIGKYDPANGHGRVSQTLHLAKFRNYHLSVQVKTKDFETAANVNILLLAGDRALQYQTLPIQKTMDWKKLDVTFNTLDNSEVTLYLGVWGGKAGVIWWDDVHIEPAGLFNLVRRAGAPFSVKSEDGQTLYREGVDYAPAADPDLPKFEFWHAAPKWTIVNGGALKPGQTVKVSYYHTALIYWGQAMACMAEPETDRLVAENIAAVRDYLHPDGYMLSHDEIRMTGWDKSCLDSGLTPGQLLARNVRRCTEAVRSADPGKPIYVWSDMFDPNHNAKSQGTYYLVKGDGPWKGAWQGLDPEVTVLNWNSSPESRKASLKFFSERGSPQILAGYYDGPVDAIQTWLRDAAGLSGVLGVMYTTWVSNFADLEPFLKRVNKRLTP
jgi:hypothetical protein